MEDPGRPGNGFHEEQASSLEERLGPQLTQVREALVEANAKALRILRAYPGACLLGAVGVGFLLGRLVSRR